MEEYHELNQLVDDFDEEISTAPQKKVEEQEKTNKSIVLNAKKN